MKRGQAILEGRVAELLEQEYLSLVPLIEQPLLKRPFVVKTERLQKVGISYQPEGWRLARMEEEPRLPVYWHQLTFVNAALVAVRRGPNWLHCRRYKNRGLIRGNAFFEVHNSRTLRREPFAHNRRLTHWIFYHHRHRVEVIAEDVAPGRDYDLLCT